MAPKKVDKDARRRAILEAAAGVFARHGYRQATVDQITEAAGISKGTVYLYFASKEDLFYALFEQLTRDAMVAPTDAVEAPPDTLSRIHAVFQRAMATIDANESLIPLTLEFWSAAGVEETRNRFGARYGELFADFRNALIGMMKDGISKGEIASGLPVEALASCLMAVIDGLLLQQWTDPRFKASTAMEAALPTLLESLRART